MLDEIIGSSSELAIPARFFLFRGLFACELPLAMHFFGD